MEGTIKVKETKKANARLIVGVLASGIVAVLVAFVIIPRLGGMARPPAPDYWPTEVWQSSTPEAQGIDSALLADALLTWREQNVQIHSLQIIRNGYMVTDATFYPYDGQTVHDVASATKSVMTTLIGIAVDQGKLKLDDKMVSFFPDRTIANLDARKEDITVRHLVSMTSGLQCVRDGTEGDTTLEMHRSPDYVQFALDLPVAYEPGSQFVYCSPAISLLSPILQQATGMSTLEFARQYLFEPLGIHDVLWETDPQGYYAGHGDLSLHPHDMAKLGLLFLQEGRWEDRQVISRLWVKEARTAQSVMPSEEDSYGYGWWLAPDLEGVYRAEGRNGQYIYILPGWNMILVTTGGGFEIGEIAEPILEIIGAMEETLPDNPAGVTRLEEAAAVIAQPPAASPVAPLPEIARIISGQTYVFESNLLGLESVTFAFDDSIEGNGDVKAANNTTIPLSIGLDGVYRFRFDEVGRLVAARGSWTDAETFVLEYNNVTGNDQFVLRFHFQGDRVEGTLSDAYFGSGPKFEGLLQK
jgi:CubicO group peptidase (beta-lactamase class C family)